MNYLKPWQKMIYWTGEFVMIAGLVWAAVHVFFIKGCPISPFNHFTLIVIGLGLCTIPLNPVAARKCLRPIFEKLLFVTHVWWTIALAGIIYSLIIRLSSPVPGSHLWLYVLIPAILYFWIVIPSKSGTKPNVPTKADEPPAVSDRETLDNNIETDKIESSSIKDDKEESKSDA